MATKRDAGSPAADRDEYQRILARTVAAGIAARVATVPYPEKLLGSPESLAERMLAAVPSPNAFADVIGPAYTQAGLARAMGVSRQAIHDRTINRRLWALRTSDDHVVYPARQFAAGSFTPLPHLLQILAEFDAALADEWTIASWLAASQPELGGSSVLDVLESGGSAVEAEPLVTARELTRATAHRWNR